MLLIVLCLIALLVIRLSQWIYAWQNPKCSNGKLPPGSMGFPIIGETIEFIKNSEGLCVPPFIQKRLARYGSIFRTNLFGQNMVVIGDSEVCHRLFQKDGESLASPFTQDFIPIFDPESVVTTPGMVYKCIKSLTLQLIGNENLKKTILREINESIRRHVQSWASHDIVDVREAISNMVLDYIAKRLISYDERKAARNVKENLNAFIRGLISIPLNIPGTKHHACLQGRDNVRKVIKDSFEERKASKMISGDFLDYLLEEVKKEDTILSEPLARDIVFGIIFATYVTSNLALTLSVKFLSEHPQVLAELKKEHEAILKRRGSEDSEITWEEYKSMTFTQMVINETVRLGNIAPGIFRKVAKDIEIKGHTIPAGWMIMINTSVLHLDPNNYNDPLAFNPWRWEGKGTTKSSRSFIGFGLVPRICVGADLAKLQMAIFLHHLVLNCRWELLKGEDIKQGEDIIQTPWLEYPHGLYMKIISKQPE